MGYQGSRKARLEYLMQDADGTLAQVTDLSVLAELLAIGGDVSDFSSTTDSLEALSNAIGAISTADPFLASVGGALNAAVASGAVTDTDTAMAYIKQLVTEAILQSSDYLLTGTSPDTGGTANTSTRIELDGDASAVDGAYDPAMVVITGGTGSGQARQIFEYDGTNKYAYVNRDWKVTPDDTSTYTIMASSGNTHVNEGVATGGGASTITLNSLASAQDGLYNEHMVIIVAGTGADQSRRVVGYNGTTKVATVDYAWVVQPDTTSVYAMIPSLGNSTLNVAKFGGTIAYVNAAAADDTHNGLTPLTPKKTIAAGQVVAGIGGAVSIKAGTYVEDVVMSYAAQELWPEIGVVFDGTGTCITISADSCKLGRPGDRFVCSVAADQLGVLVTAAGTKSFINGAMAIGAASAGGFEINGAGGELHYCRATGVKAGGKAFDGGVSQVKLYDCATTGDTTSYGYYFGGATINRGLIVRCTSAGHQTSGFYLDDNVSLVTVIGCSSGGGDGDKVDSGTNNMWAGFTDRLGDEHHEHIYPRCTGQGVAGGTVSVSNATTDGAGGTRDDENYWGDVVTVIPMSTLTTIWNSIGLYIHANTAADIQQWDIFFPRTAFGSAQNGGNDWDENETVLTVADGSIFEDGDFVWITGTDKANGEILMVSGAPVGNVVTIARETTADAEAGLRYDYDGTPGANIMYVASRPGTPSLHRIEGDYSAATTKDMKAYRWHLAREMPPNTGMLMRMLNATDDGASSFDVRAIYED